MDGEGGRVRGVTDSDVAVTVVRKRVRREVESFIVVCGEVLKTEKDRMDDVCFSLSLQVELQTVIN